MAAHHCFPQLFDASQALQARDTQGGAATVRFHQHMLSLGAEEGAAETETFARCALGEGKAAAKEGLPVVELAALASPSTPPPTACGMAPPSPSHATACSPADLSQLLPGIPTQRHTVLSCPLGSAVSCPPSWPGT